MIHSPNPSSPVFGTNIEGFKKKKKDTNQDILSESWRNQDLSVCIDQIFVKSKDKNLTNGRLVTSTD